MDLESGYINKICSFYAGDCHFATMMLPYLVKNIKSHTNINTILDENMEEYMEQLINNINIEDRLKKEIKNINWNQSNIEDIEKYIKEILKPNSKNILIIKIAKNTINKEIRKVINKNKEYILHNNIKLNLIFCYNIENLKSVDNIICDYEYVLNTSGIHEIKEVFQYNIKDKQEKFENKYVG